jgi:dTDP-4-dehydrorhamnose 3,5-epimerase
MRVSRTAIPDVLLIEPKVFQDSRGFFLETFQAQKYAQVGLPEALVQDNHSGSHGGVLRGLHYQVRQAQGKLVSVVVGRVFDVAVDLRRSSPTFAKWVGIDLRAEDRRQLWIPPGFAHGFYVLSPWAEVTYKVTEYYSPQWERTLRWDDPTVNIQWPLPPGAQPTLSPKDAQGALFAAVEFFDD